MASLSSAKSKPQIRSKGPLNSKGQKNAIMCEIVRRGRKTSSRSLLTVGRLQVGIAGGAVGGGVVLEVEKKSEHD